MNLKNISIIVALLSALSGVGYKAWSMDAQLSATIGQLASVSDETRKLSIRTRMWRMDDRIDYLDRKYDSTRDEYYRRKGVELRAERDCLERALDIKHKWPRDCRR